MADLSIAERMFAGSDAESELDVQLYEAGVQWERSGFDWYDCSLELYGVPPDYRLSADVQRIIHAAGFAKVYVNHEDKWETHYSWPVGAFKEAKGWRVSYPHKRNDGTTGIWVEDFLPSWPKEWFDTGYALIKKVIGQ